MVISREDPLSFYQSIHFLVSKHNFFSDPRIVETVSFVRLVRANNLCQRVFFLDSHVVKCSVYVTPEVDPYH